MPTAHTPPVQVVVPAQAAERQSVTTLVRESSAPREIQRDTSNFIRPRANGQEGDMLELMMLGH